MPVAYGGPLGAKSVTYIDIAGPSLEPPTNGYVAILHYVTITKPGSASLSLAINVVPPGPLRGRFSQKVVTNDLAALDAAK